MGNKIIKLFLMKVLGCLLLFLLFLIVVKADKNNFNLIYDNVYNNSISFAKINSWYKSNFGELFFMNSLNNDSIPVFQESLVYSNISSYNDGAILSVSDNYLVPFLRDGIIIFMGYKDGCGDAVIVESEDGLDIWYCNIKTTNVSIYDYVKKGDFVGEVEGNKLILFFYMNGVKKDYKEYI